MDELDRRQWVVPRTRGWMHGIDLALLDPADADERGLLIQAELARFCRSTPDPGLRMLALAAFDPGDPASVEWSTSCERIHAPAPLPCCG